MWRVFVFSNYSFAMTLPKDVTAYNKALDKTSRDISVNLAELIDATLSKAEAKVWHGAPVWFLGGNPVVGYSKKKAGVELLFWSGQSFEEDRLTATGKFKAVVLKTIDHKQVGS